MKVTSSSSFKKQKNILHAIDVVTEVVRMKYFVNFGEKDVTPVSRLVKHLSDACNFCD